MISSRFDHNPDHIHIPRVRADRGYVELERSPPPFGITRGDIAAAVAVILLGILAFPAAELLAAIVAGPHP